MGMITAKQAAEKWNITVRRVQDYCKSGRIPGAERFGTSWMIPENSVQPSDMRKKSADKQNIPKPLIRKTLFLDMTDLYSKPGTVDECIKALADNPESQMLFELEIAYSRGEIDSVYEKSKLLLKSHSGFYATLAGGVLLGLCAMWRGDMELWQAAKKHICEAPAKTESEHNSIAFALTALGCAVYDTLDLPEWFKMGIFESLHPDSLPAAKVFYIKYLYMAGVAVATKQFKLEGVNGTTLLAMLPNTVEPMISQAMADRSVITEAYLRLLCSKIYYSIGKYDDAARHMDRALELIVPDRLFGILAENRRDIENFMDKRIAEKIPEISDTVKKLHSSLSVGWSKINSKVLNKRLSTNLTPREREVARLATFGMSNTEIADALHISVAAVKQTIRQVFSKSGVNSRSQLITIL